MSLLKQDTTRKRQVDKATSQLKFESNDSNGEEYKVEAICNGMVYIRELEDHLPDLY